MSATTSHIPTCPGYSPNDTYLFFSSVGGNNSYVGIRPMDRGPGILTLRSDEFSSEIPGYDEALAHCHAKTRLWGRGTGKIWVGMASAEGTLPAGRQAATSRAAPSFPTDKAATYNFMELLANHANLFGDGWYLQLLIERHKGELFEADATKLCDLDERRFVQEANSARTWRVANGIDEQQAIATSVSAASVDSHFGDHDIFVFWSFDFEAKTGKHVIMDPDAASHGALSFRPFSTEGLPEVKEKERKEALEALVHFLASTFIDSSGTIWVSESLELGGFECKDDFRFKKGDPFDLLLTPRGKSDEKDSQEHFRAFRKRHETTMQKADPDKLFRFPDLYVLARKPTNQTSEESTQ